MAVQDDALLSSGVTLASYFPAVFLLRLHTQKLETATNVNAKNNPAVEHEPWSHVSDVKLMPGVAGRLRLSCAGSALRSPSLVTQEGISIHTSNAITSSLLSW